MKKFFLPRITLLALLTGIIILALFVTGEMPFSSSTAPTPTDTTLGEQIRHGTLPPPPFGTSTAEKLQLHHSFQALVSYTDHGFEPATVTIKAGETVRFTNNSSHELWVGATSTNGVIYPKEHTNLCGQSSLDSCLPPVQPQDFWEVTLTEKGEWHYANLIDNKAEGVVGVQ